MKFLTTLFTFGLAIGALAEPIPKPKRQVDAYKEVLYSIVDQIAIVDTLITAYVNGQVPGDDVQAASDELVAVINDGATTITGLPPLSVLDVLGLVGEITDIIDDTSGVVDNLIAAEPTFAADGLDDDVLAGLLGLEAASENLRTAIVPKVPSALQGLADSLAAQVTAELQRAIDAYSD
ncbi:hypothetical protein VTO42DRAFT_3132 [Malbranchea cinnamomea]